MKAIKITPDGTCSSILLDSVDIWDAIKEEFDRTSVLGYHTAITRAKDAIYEFFYDDSGVWADSEMYRNVVAEDISGLMWYGPCIILKVNTEGADLNDDSDFENVIYNETKTYVDVMPGDDQDIIEFLHELRVLL